jgi:hypothetical protein
MMKATRDVVMEMVGSLIGVGLLSFVFCLVYLGYKLVKVILLV